MDDHQHDNRVRERAHRLWLEEGQPEGRSDAHWDLARELVAIEENQGDTLLPGSAEAHAGLRTTEAVEELSVIQNGGEFPTLTDQGEEATVPDRANVDEADEAPLSVARKKRR